MGSRDVEARPAPRRALVVGRFQPPHRGHLEVLRVAAAAADELVVVIGSAQRSHTRTDPLTAGERMEALAGLQMDAGLQAQAIIVPLDDLGQYHLWVRHVEAHTPSFHVVVSGNPMTLHLFRTAGYETVPVEPAHRDQWSGTAIRASIYAGRDPNDALTPRVRRFLDQETIRSRMQAIAARPEGTR